MTSLEEEPAPSRQLGELGELQMGARSHTGSVGVQFVARQARRGQKSEPITTGELAGI